MTRVEVIQHFIDAGPHPSRYLEIGLDAGDVFFFVGADDKTAVDIVRDQSRVRRNMVLHYNDPRTKASLQPMVKLNPRNTYHWMTSTQFFDQKASGLYTVIFIDANHTMKASYLDATHALKFLDPKGCLILHDACPKSESEAGPVQREANWSGEVWKAVMMLRLNPILDVWTLDEGYGFGIVSFLAGPLRHKKQLDMGPRDIENLTYSDLAANRRAFLNTRER